MFILLQQGPTVVLRSMEKRLSIIEQGSNSNGKGASNNKLKKILELHR